MEKCIFYIGCFLILLSIVMVILLRWYLVKYTTSLTSCLDEMIGGRREIVFDEENELLMAKVQVKLRQLYEIMERRTEQSRKDRENLQEIISDISHQVKTPIANIRMYHTIMQNRKLDADQTREFSQAVDVQIDKLDSLIQSMIEMSRMEVGMIKVTPVYQRIYPLIEQAVCAIALKAEEKAIDMTVQCESYIKAVYDLKWTREALENILDNAVKYTPHRGQIRISVGVTDFFTKIEIADNGKGIPEEHYTKIFKRFYREADVSQEEGVGIGLFLAREIVRKQKGYIDVKSKPGVGSSFCIYLPADE